MYFRNNSKLQCCVYEIPHYLSCSLAVISHSAFITAGYLWSVDVELFHLSLLPANICVGLNQPCDTLNLLSLARLGSDVNATRSTHHHDVSRHASLFGGLLCEWHAGAASRRSCLILCERTTAENVQSAAVAKMWRLCVEKAAGSDPQHLQVAQQNQHPGPTLTDVVSLMAVEQIHLCLTHSCVLHVSLQLTDAQEQWFC